MDRTTRETRRQSYDTVLPKREKRCRLILETLGAREMTASEITEELVAAGEIPYFNRNYVAPRLTEMKQMGILKTVGPQEGHPLGRHRGRVGPGTYRSSRPDRGRAGRQSRHRARADDAPRPRGLTERRATP